MSVGRSGAWQQPGEVGDVWHLGGWWVGVDGPVVPAHDRLRPFVRHSAAGARGLHAQHRRGEAR